MACSRSDSCGKLANLHFSSLGEIGVSLPEQLEFLAGTISVEHSLGSSSHSG